MNPDIPISVGPQDNLNDLVADLPDGAIVELAPGTYRANLWVERSLTLRGSGATEVILDGDFDGPVIEVARLACRVHLSGLTLRQGQGSRGQGGNLSVHESTDISCYGVIFEDGKADAGGGVFLREGSATFESCLFQGNHGELAQALWVYQIARARLIDCLVFEGRTGGPMITAAGPARLRLEHCTVLSDGGAALRLVSSGADAPEVDVTGSLLGDPPVEILRGGMPLPRLRVTDCGLTDQIGGDGVTDGGGNVIGPLAFTDDFRLRPGSPAMGRGARRS